MAAGALAAVVSTGIIIAVLAWPMVLAPELMVAWPWFGMLVAPFAAFICWPFIFKFFRSMLGPRAPMTTENDGAE